MAKERNLRTAKVKKVNLHETYLIETAWEVCNQVGGIFTVVRSKIPEVIEKWGDNYCLIGPLVNKDIDAEFEDITEKSSVFAKAVSALKRKGYKVRFGRWLVTGRPQVILLDPHDAYTKLNQLKEDLKKYHGIEIRDRDDLYNQVIAFAEMISEFLRLFRQKNIEKTRTTVHFHEWMSVLPALEVRRKKWDIKTVFTTHATLLGRYLAMNDLDFYSNLPEYDWRKESEKYNIVPMVQIERKGAELADVFTTVSDVTGRECKYLLDKEPDGLVPNGLNIKRFVAYHEVQNLHQKYKEEINEFVMGHFFQSYSFNLDKVLYFFTSGRYEYKNKGYDVTLEALKVLNEKLKKAKSDITVVMFFITKRPVWSINPDVLHSRGVMEEIRQNCMEITKQIDEKLFELAASGDKDHRLPDLNKLVDDYWRLRYRRTIQSWKGSKWPIVVTHNLVDDMSDEILHFLRKNNLINSPDDRVKVVYHPDFINPTNPLFGLEYSDFVRGCHLGIFPSYYEPWGYTPLESIALGVPTITSDLSGFGDYTLKEVPAHKESGVFVVKRFKESRSTVVENLAESMFNFVQKSRRDRIQIRNQAEDLSEQFDWSQLIRYYEKAYRLAHKI